jgi:hypothetical protein
VDPNDEQPGGSSGRTITLQLSRDSLILIAALVFLAIAILLALFFPTGGPDPTTSGPTSVAQPGTATAERVTASVLVFIPSPPAGTILPSSAEPEISPLPDGYPEPEISPLPEETPPELFGTADPNQVEGLPTSVEQIPAPTVALPLPTFNPERPTATTGAATGPTIAGGAVQQTAYPAPRASAATPTEELINPPTITPATPPTPALPPTPVTPPTSAVIPSPEPSPRPTRRPTPRPPPPTPAPTAIPVDVLRGNLRWTPANGPIYLRRDQQLTPGSTLIIEPGTEIRLAPGVAFFVEGTLYGLGQPGRPIRFTGSEGQRWEGIFGRPGSNIALEHTEISGGGAGGTVLASEGGNLVIHNGRINNNGGHIATTNSRLEVRDSEVAGNDMPYGAAIDASYESGGFVILTGNRVGGNRMAAGAAPVQVNNQSSTDAVVLDVQRNLLVGQDGPDLVLFQDGPFLGGLDVRLPDAGPFLGGMTCNALMSGANGLMIRSNTPQVPRLNLNVRENAIENHSPPIVPIYTKPYHGIGRGATSEITVDMRNNWWNSPTGPYEPDRHADGRGDAVGENIEFGPWLTERPACAPRP